MAESQNQRKRESKLIRKPNNQKAVKSENHLTYTKGARTLPTHMLCTYSISFDHNFYMSTKQGNVNKINLSMPGKLKKLSFRGRQGKEVGAPRGGNANSCIGAILGPVQKRDKFFIWVFHRLMFVQIQQKVAGLWGGHLSDP